MVNNMRFTTFLRETFMKTVNEYVNQVNALSAKSVETILDIGLTICEAKANLSKENKFYEFLSQIKYTKQSIKKWVKIGESYIRLKQHAKLLPPSWTTIYKISAMKPDELARLIQENILNPSITASEIEEALMKSGNKNCQYTLTIRFDATLPAEELEDAISALDFYALEYPCEVKKSKEIQNQLNSKTTNP